MRAVLLLTLACLLLCAAPAGAGAAVSPCSGWKLRTLAEGLGSLENLEPDGRGGLFLSATARGAVERLRSGGRRTTVASGIGGPGGLRLRGRRLYVNTGDTLAAGSAGEASGTLDVIDLRTGRRRTWARGLTMPNGLLFTPAGDALVSRDINFASPTGVTRIDGRTKRVQTRWADLPDTNGMALAPDGKSVYAVETLAAENRVYRIPIARPGAAREIARLGDGGTSKGLDDITIDARGVLYITANLRGEVIRLDPRSGRSCVIATGLQNPSAIKQGRGDGAFGAGRLFITGFDGRVRELRPPRGLRLERGRHS